MGLQQFDELVPFNGIGQIANDGGPQLVNMAQNNQRPLRVDCCYLSNNAVAATVVQVAVQDGYGTLGPLGAVSVPGGAGYTSAAVDVFPLVLDANQQGIVLTPGNTLVLSVPGGALSGALVSWFIGGGGV